MLLLEVVGGDTVTIEVMVDGISLNNMVRLGEETEILVAVIFDVVITGDGDAGRDVEV